MSYLVLGAGMMGTALVHDLVVTSGIGTVTVADMDISKLEALKKRHGAIDTLRLDLKDKDATASMIKGKDILINATSYTLNPGLTRLAIDHRCHMLDLGGNMTVVEGQMAMDAEAEKAGVTILPNCGLAPGLANVLGTYLLNMFDEPRALKIFVGGLPQDPVPPMNYMQLFSIQGLINEYVEPCDAIVNGSLVKVDPLTGLEEVEFSEPFGILEAFNTSGGISLMIRTYDGRVDTMYYKTLRYPGHCAIFKALLDMGLMSDGPMELDDLTLSPRAALEKALETNLPKEGPDVTLMKIVASGTKDGNEGQRTIEIIDLADEGSGMSSMMRTTAFPTSIIAQMVMDGTITKRGVFTPETVVDGERLIRELDKRGIRTKINWTSLKQ